MLLLLLLFELHVFVSSQKTTISIQGDNFYINKKLTYESASDSTVHGLLINSRMVQGIFDDYNSSTVNYWDYPDSKQWDPLRNTNEFIGNMSVWRNYNLLAFTLGLQGGRPSRAKPDHSDYPQPWMDSAFHFNNGSLDHKYMQRLQMILPKADELGMIVILQFFYFGQIAHFPDYKNNTLIYKSIDNIIEWLLNTSYTNIMIDVANECNEKGYVGTILSPQNGAMTNTIKYIKNKLGSRFNVGSSFTGGSIPPNDIINVSDIILVHGNGVSPDGITKMVNTIRSSDGYKQKPKPILFTEDFSTDTTSSSNNMKSAINAHASWGFMTECNSTDDGDYVRYYQCPPVAWDIDTQIKKNFFNVVKNYTSTY
eukprot:441636_1